MFNVNPSLIRFWEKEFDIIKPQKNKKGNRLFTKKDIEKFRKIYELVKEKGYTLQGAKDQLKGTNTEDKALEAREKKIAETLQQLKDFLLDIKKDL
jgi:DNA-binding transcriptional MerR regulator